MDDAFAELEAQLLEITGSAPNSRANSVVLNRGGTVRRESVVPPPINTAVNNTVVEEWKQRAQAAELRAEALEGKIKKLVAGVKGTAQLLHDQSYNNLFQRKEHCSRRYVSKDRASAKSAHHCGSTFQ
jgi:hypothetical protein